jgi:hypothetical protein
MSLNVEVDKQFVVSQHDLALENLLPGSEELSSLLVKTYTMLCFRVGSAINSFRIADWEDSFSRRGMHSPAIEFNGHLYPPYHMTAHEQVEFKDLGDERRRATREMIAKYIDQSVVGLIEASASARTTDSFMLAQELIDDSVFVPAYRRLMSSLIDPDGENLGDLPRQVSQLRWIMLIINARSREWCPERSRASEAERVQ